MYKYLIIALVILSMAGTIGLLYKDNKKLSGEVVTLTNSLAARELELTKIKTGSTVLNGKLKEKEDKLRITEQYLEAMSGREATLVAKPKLVEKLIQTAVSDRESRIECATGGLCKD